MLALVIAFMFLFIAGIIFTWRAFKTPGPDLPLQDIAWALIAFGLAAWLYYGSNHLNHILDNS